MRRLATMRLPGARPGVICRCCCTALAPPPASTAPLLPCACPCSQRATTAAAGASLRVCQRLHGAARWGGARACTSARARPRRPSPQHSRASSASAPLPATPARPAVPQQQLHEVVSTWRACIKMNGRQCGQGRGRASGGKGRAKGGVAKEDGSEWWGVPPGGSPAQGARSGHEMGEGIVGRRSWQCAGSMH